MSYDKPKLIRYFPKGEEDIQFECSLYIQHVYFPTRAGWKFEINYPKLHFTWDLQTHKPGKIYLTKVEAILAGMVQVYTNQIENENIA